MDVPKNTPEPMAQVISEDGDDFLSVTYHTKANDYSYMPDIHNGKKRALKDCLEAISEIPNIDVDQDPDVNEFRELLAGKIKKIHNDRALRIGEWLLSISAVIHFLVARNAWVEVSCVETMSATINFRTSVNDKFSYTLDPEANKLRVSRLEKNDIGESELCDYKSFIYASHPLLFLQRNYEKLYAAGNKGELGELVDG